MDGAQQRLRVALRGSEQNVPYFCTERGVFTHGQIHFLARQTTEDFKVVNRKMLDELGGNGDAAH